MAACADRMASGDMQRILHARRKNGLERVGLAYSRLLPLAWEKAFSATCLTFAWNNLTMKVRAEDDMSVCSAIERGRSRVLPVPLWQMLH